MTRFFSLALCAVLLTSAATFAAATRSLEIFNSSGNFIDVGILQPPGSRKLYAARTINAGQSETIDLPDRATRITVRSDSCHGHFEYTLPTKSHVRVTVRHGCKINAN